MAALAVPLVCSVHSIVGLDFAASLMPGWQEPIFPPYFVVGAMYSGFAMVILLATLIRWGLRLEAIITANGTFESDGPDHARRLAHHGIRATPPSGSSGWYGGEHADRSVIAFEFTGTYRAWLYWALLAVQRRAAAGALVATGAAQPAGARAVSRSASSSACGWSAS